MRLLLLLLLAELACGFNHTVLFMSVNDTPTTVTIRPDNFKCISIYGLETNLKNTVCSWRHPATYYIEEVHKMGFNTLRIPVSMQYVTEGDMAVLDSIVDKSDELGIQVFLDIHRVSNEYQQPTPDKGIEEYSGIGSRDDFMNQITKLITRYRSRRSVIAINSWNEYTGMDVGYKVGWDTQFFNVVESVLPGRFILISTGLLWGGILSGYSLEHLPYSDRIVYSVHKYHFSGSGDRSDWESSFGNAFPPEKILIGEWGFRDPEDMDFGNRFSEYLLEKQLVNQCFWTIAHSGDTGGLWYDDCQNVNQNKLNIIKKLLD